MAIVQENPSNLKRFRPQTFHEVYVTTKTIEESSFFYFYLQNTENCYPSFDTKIY